MTSRFWILVCFFLIAVSSAPAQSTELKPFTSRDAAEMAYFGNIFDSSLEQPYDDGALSPDGRYALKVSHRGVLPEGVTEGTLWLFDVDDVVESIRDAGKALPAPLVLARVSAAINGYSTDFVNRGNTLLHPKWSDDSKSVYFLGRDGQENRRLYKVDVDSRDLEALSPADRDIFAYSVSGLHIVLLAGRNIDADAVWQTAGTGVDDIVVGTGTALNPLLFPNFLEYASDEPLMLEVWRVQGGTAEPVGAATPRGAMEIVAEFADADIALSPDGAQAVVKIAGSSRQDDSATPSAFRIIDLESAEYRDSTDLDAEGLTWTPFEPQPPKGADKLQLTVAESLNKPPVLVATKTDTGESRAIFDPNPQLANLVVLPVNVIEWEDQHGRTIVGGLLKPANFDPERRYPLVIQTHGFRQDRFFRVGFSDTANAGRALAARDIVVLQVEEPYPWDDMPADLEKAGMDVYVAAIDELALLGIIDPEKVGISGYSFTGLTAAISITRAPERFAAAVLANCDPLTMTGYYSYVDSPLHGQVERLFTGVAPNDKEGLQVWIDKSPALTTSSIKAPVLVTAADPFHLLSLWDFYAALRYQGKAVELQYIRSGKHNLVKPLHRIAHQEVIVDWFDFWLNEHRDDDPDKVEQYRRWKLMKRSRQMNQ